jgi:palmitoyl-protein thioesterase
MILLISRQYGNVNEQIEQVANQLADVEELEDGFDAIGFSQGLSLNKLCLFVMIECKQAGQFLRAYVERYNAPPVHNLITFGSQHMGVSDVPPCSPGDFLCQIARRAVKSGVYSNWAQNNLVQVCDTLCLLLSQNTWTDGLWAGPILPGP